MQFFVTCLDKADSKSVREATRNAHLAYLRENDSNVLGAGPILAEDQQSVIGSLLLIQADDAQSATVFVAGDPYFKAGLFESTQIRPWRWLFKHPA